MGAIAIFDKSALQALNIDEAVWFDTFFLANVVPIFALIQFGGGREGCGPPTTSTASYLRQFSTCPTPSP